MPLSSKEQTKEVFIIQTEPEILRAILLLLLHEVSLNLPPPSRGGVKPASLY